MNIFFEQIKRINSEDAAISLLISILPATFNKELILSTISFASQAHKGQKRKSGEDYIVHPILVSAIVAFIDGDEDMIIAALLHDVVEDTDFNLEYVSANYSDSIAHLVDGLTKITDIKDEFKVTSKKSDSKLISTALSFRKMLIASIVDIRVLVIKLSDRVHNMLTLDALPKKKQIKIAEETLVVFAPIAHRLGISVLKNILEDTSFYYIMPNEYKKIDEYIQNNRHKLDLNLHEFTNKLSLKLNKSGYDQDDFEIKSRVKHHYSIYIKTQRKGVNIDEVLDLLAIRIILKKPNDCYNVLGIIHQNFRPLIARFKDYIAIPKENGYQTLHTTVFNGANIYEVQIRTKDMDRNAEFGMAAHWEYKSSNTKITKSVEWLKSLQYNNSDVTEFYELAKNDLYTDDIIVISPKGENYTLPQDATALDFAYLIHSDIGDYAEDAFINGAKKSLLSTLKNGDNVYIKTSTVEKARCSWIDSVKTSKAKNHIKNNCKTKLKDINLKVNTNILSHLFGKDVMYIENFIHEDKVLIEKLSHDIYTFDDLKDLKMKLRDHLANNSTFFGRLKLSFVSLKIKEIDSFNIYSNRQINRVDFDYCCHPKFGDEIVSFKNGRGIVVHHKLCENAHKKINNHEEMVFVEWKNIKRSSYKMIISLENKKGSLATFLDYLTKYDINVLMIDMGNKSNEYYEYCDMKIDTDISDINKIRGIISKKSKLIELYEAKDAYK